MRERPTLPLPAAPAPPKDGQWTMPAGDYAATRYSGLDQIDASNVGRLALSWTFSTGVPRGHEAAPLVVGRTMYIVTPYPNYLYALDLARPRQPLKWRFAPGPAPGAPAVACCDVVNRGAFYHAGRVFYNALDDLTWAVDAATGKPLWHMRVGDVARGETTTMAPLVADGRVFVGISGGSFGVRGRLVALDEATGAVAWTGYSTGPDTAVMIGARYRPFYPWLRGRDLGTTTWPREAWRHGGGGVWGWLSYDPAQHLLFHGTGDPGPDPAQHPGMNAFSNTIFAREARGGDVVWAYILSPHDLHDYDGVNENVLLDMTLGGRPRRLLAHADRNGYLYILDRTTGEVLSADPFVAVTTSAGVNLRTGRLRQRPTTQTPGARECPASIGGKNWPPMAYSPRTGYLYIPAVNVCHIPTPRPGDAVTALDADAGVYRGQGGFGGQLLAWDVARRRAAWSLPDPLPLWSGALVTAGDIVFYGTLAGWFRAVDARSGRILWQYRTGAGIVGQPIAYRGPDGREYIAVLSGVGGWLAHIAAHDRSAPLSPGRLYVFALPPDNA